MNFLKIILITLFIGCASPVRSQDVNAIPERTPEQEAARQTEKLQQELQLTPEQTRKAHEINLKYARARKESNSRSESIKRIKDKETELMRILDSKQRANLKNKRYERSSFHANDNDDPNPRTQNELNTNTPDPESKLDNNRTTTRSVTERDNSRAVSPRTTIQNPPTRTSSGSSKQADSKQTDSKQTDSKQTGSKQQRR